MSVAHDRSMLGAYALGVLDAHDAKLVHDHLATCAECRREIADLADLRTMLDDVPPEAFLDGPPDDGELILQRTLRAARAQRPAVTMAQPAPRRWGLVAASVLIIAGAALGGGVLIGRQTAPVDSLGQPPVSEAPNLRRGEATDPRTGARAVVNLAPQAGWVRVNLFATGIPKGERCEIFVVPRTGEPVLVGSWLVSDNGARNGTSLDGAGLIDPTEVVRVDIVNTDGRTFVSVPV